MPDLVNALAAWDARDPPAVTAGPVAGDALAAETPRLRRLVHRLLGWPARAGEVDDVVQEALLAAWRHRGSFRGDAQWTTWLTRIALRKAHDHARAAMFRARLFGWWRGAANEPAANEPAASEPVEPDERLDATRRALQQLAHADREVLVLRYLEQREVEQIAALLGRSRAAIDARLSRARGRLRALLDLPGAP